MCATVVAGTPWSCRRCPPDANASGSGTCSGRAGRCERRYLDAATILGRLHSHSAADLGLGDEPVLSLGDEIDRLTRVFETIPDDLRGDYRACAAALHAVMPAATTPVVNHGDCRLGNLLCDGDAVTAVVG